MQILGRLNFPKSTDVSSLYMRCSKGAAINYEDNYKEIVFEKGSSISSNSYFNSFYEKFYAKYTTIKSIYYLLKLEGDFQIAVYREVYGATNRELIFIDKFENCQLSEPVKVLLPNLIDNENAGRIYVEIVCLSERGLFQECLIATAQNKDREVSLAIISCTFKKEAYIINTVNSILEDTFLLDKPLKIFVVDNDKTLEKDDFTNAKLQLIPNKNVGGSGGFTRGLIEALESNTYSHFLLMDDDIELDSECIYRLFALYEYGKFDFAVAGSMLDLYKKHILYEAGSLYGKAHNMGNKPFAIINLKYNVNLENHNHLNLLLLEENIDYGVFGFFAFSKKIVEKIGLPLPLFIKGDDIEFCLRIKESLSSRIVAFPSIAVWHEPFYAKFPIWNNYYLYRSNLIIYALNENLEYIKAINNFTQQIVHSLFVFDYNYAQMLVKAFEDYVKGPDIIKNNAPEVLHSNVLELSKSSKNQDIQPNYFPPANQVYHKSRAGSLLKIISLLTLNGHLIPNFLTSDDEVFIWHSEEYSGQRSKAFAKKKVSLFKKGTTFLFQNEIDKLAGIKILTRCLKIAAVSSAKWSSISRTWKKASSELMSTNFWQEYVGIKY